MPDTSCIDLPSAACDEQSRRLATAHPGARSLEIECGPAPCTRARGAGTATMVLADGRKVTEPWAYAGDPNPLPIPTCKGLAVPLCRQWALSAADDVAPSRRITAVALTCISQTCTDAEGQVSVDFTFVDGSQMTINTGWSGP